MERMAQVQTSRIVAEAQSAIVAARAELSELGRSAQYQLLAMLDAETAGLRHDLLRDIPPEAFRQRMTVLSEEG